jgi:hypothetical protein
MSNNGDHGDDAPLLLPLVKTVKKERRAAQAQSSEKKEYFLEVQLVNPNGQALAFTQALVTFDDGREYRKASNEYGVVRIDGLTEPGNYRVTLPALAERVGVTREEEDGKITIDSVDRVFAPGEEDLDIQCSFRGVRYKKVTLEITSENYADGPIYSRLLTRDEKKRGDHTLYWNGQANCTGGDLAEGQFINPLYSPYRVRIYSQSGDEAEEGFSVRYHSLKIAKGAWTPNEQEPGAGNEKDWAQYMLNTLGYYGGPVGKGQEEYLTKAIIHYKANHKNLRINEFNYGAYDDSITEDLKTALTDGDNPLPTVDSEAIGDADRSDVPIFVEAIAYQSSAEFDEFEEKDKAHFEAERMSRPLIPLEASIRLCGKNGGAVDAPSAVGAVRVNWSFADYYSGMSSLPDHTAAAPSQTRTYVENALAYEDEGFGDNCHVDYGGLRDNANDDWHAYFLLDDSYAPYTAAKDEGNKVVYSKVCVDDANYGLRVGKAGIYLHPSNMAGDSFQISAEISFDDLDNKEAVEAEHDGIVLTASTCVFEIVRQAKVSAMVGWPNRQLRNIRALGWQETAAEFESARHQIDYGNISELGIDDVLTVEEYKAVVYEKCKVVAENPEIFPPEDFELHPNWMLGVSLPPQDGADGDLYYKTMKIFLSENYWKLMVGDLGKQISKNVRKTHANGFVMVDVLAHEPITILEDPTLPPGTDNRELVDWVFPIPSAGLADSIFFIDMTSDSHHHPHYLLSHEMAHCLWLQHFEYTDTPYPRQHDLADHNCTMSYTDSECDHAHHRPETFDSHFCGKCNLKLRGWDIRGLPASSDGTTEYVDDLPAVELLTGVQTRLNLLDYNSGPVDGIFGPITEGAVISFQQNSNGVLAVDGIPGPNTQAHLVLVYGR